MKRNQTCSEGGAGNGADTALDGLGRTEAKAVRALTPHPPHSKTLARGEGGMVGV